MPNLEASPNKSIGFRVKSAREAMGLAQDQLSSAMGYRDRQTVSDIENGKRSLKAEELVRLSDVLNKEIEFFLDPFEVAGEAAFSWRVSPEVPDGVLAEFEGRAGKLVGLLRWLRSIGPETPSPLKFNLRLSIHSTFEEVQACGEDLAKMFAEGQVPADRLVAFMERQLDLPVLFVDIPGSANISGAFSHLSELGVVVVNRKESPRRLNFDLAHELFHALTWESMPPEHRETNSPGVCSENPPVLQRKNRRLEQLADNFAAALLMPTPLLETLIDPERREDSAHLADVASKLGVTHQALGWRLFNLKKISSTTRAAISYERPSSTQTMPPKLFSRDLVALLNVAIEGGRISPRKAAKTLDLNLNQFVALFKEYGLPDPLGN